MTRRKTTKKKMMKTTTTTMKRMVAGQGAIQAQVLSAFSVSLTFHELMHPLPLLLLLFQLRLPLEPPRLLLLNYSQR